MRLYLMQHGEAKPKEADPERGLTERGHEDVESVARFLKTAGIKVSRVIHSGKPRAKQTAAILFGAIGYEATLDTTDMIGPTDPPEPFAYEVGELTTDTLVVGHLPFMSRLVSLFILGQPEVEIASYRPGSIVCLERQGDGQWAISWMLRPELFSHTAI